MLGKLAKMVSGASSSKDGAAKRAQIEKLLERGRAKDAYKEAKVLFRDHETPENRQLLERTFLARVESLFRDGMTNAAREVADNFLDFGVTDPPVLAKLVALLPAIGLGDKALSLTARVGGVAAASEEVTLKIVDQAVRNPALAPASMPEIKSQAERIRAALAALDAGNEEAANEALRAIPRASHFADWRLFVRGLLAQRRGDAENVEANWSRLDPQRAAARIVAKLKERDLASMLTPEQLHPLEKRTFGEPVLERLQQLGAALRAADWNRVKTLVTSVRRPLERANPKWVHRLTNIVLADLVQAAEKLRYEKAEELVRSVTTALPPLPWDPQWRRLWGVLWEGEAGNALFAIDCWTKFARDLESCPVDSLGPRSLAQALVWRRIGKLYTIASRSPKLDIRDATHRGLTAEQRLQRMRDHLHHKAGAAFDKSLELKPNHAETLYSYIVCVEQFGDMDKVFELRQQFASAAPHDVDNLAKMTTGLMKRKRYAEALENGQRLRRLEPLFHFWRRLENLVRFEIVREHALAERWDDARAEFERIEVLDKSHFPMQRHWVVGAVLAWKAGHPERARECQARAAKECDPIALALALAIEARRFRLEPVLLSRCEVDAEKAVRKKASPTAAVRIAYVLNDHMPAYGSDFAKHPDLKDSVELAMKYLQKTARLNYDEESLRTVCEFLNATRTDDELLTKLVRKGRRYFPKQLFFRVADLRAQVSKTPLPPIDFFMLHREIDEMMALAKTQADNGGEDLRPMLQQVLDELERRQRETLMDVLNIDPSLLFDSDDA